MLKTQSMNILSTSPLSFAYLQSAMLIVFIGVCISTRHELNKEGQLCARDSSMEEKPTLAPHFWK